SGVSSNGHKQRLSELSKRICEAHNQTDGGPCRQAPLRGGTFCFWHNPDSAEAAAEARRLGGQRRRRESTLAGAYEFDGIDSPDDLKRLLDIATYDALALENSVARVRTIVAIVQAGSRLLEGMQIAERL